VVVVVAASVPARAFTLSETSAALGTANGLAAANGISGARTRGIVQRRLGGLGTAAPGGFSACGRGASARTPAKNWRRPSDAGARLRMSAAWKRGGLASARATRAAWSRASDPSRCR
jgi:hypothetical protein